MKRIFFAKDIQSFLVLLHANLENNSIKFRATASLSQTKAKGSLTEHCAARTRHATLESITSAMTRCARAYCPIRKYVCANQYTSLGSSG